jgi:hypothetical protein
MFNKLFFVILAVTMFSGCARVDVQTGGDSRINIATLKNFGWLEVDSAIGGKVRVQNPNVDGWVKTSVEKALQKKGYVKSTASEPDFLITWLGGVEHKVKQESIDHFYRNYGYGPVGKKVAGGETGSKGAYEYEEGTLILDLLDPVSHKTLWHATATGRLLKEMSQEQGELYVDKLVRQILKRFPESME